MLTVQAFTFNPMQENTYVLYNEKKDCCIIDPGCYFATEEQKLLGFIHENGLKPRFLLNTHCHLDHIFGNKLVHRTYGLSLHLHQLEEPVLRFGPATAQLWQLPLDQYDGELKFLSEGDPVALGEDELHVLFTPGHSPGSICFHNRAGKFVIGGDVLFQGSIGRTDLPGGSYEQLAVSMRERILPLDDDIAVLPGHGSNTTIGRERRTNPFILQMLEG